MTLTLAVVIPTLNGAHRLGRSLGGLARQERPIDELIVVDDGSSDDTCAVAQEHGARVLSHPHNRGSSVARNTGRRAAHADIVAFLDDDCDPEPTWSRRLLEPYHDPAVVAVGGRIDPVGAPAFITRYLQRNNPARPLERELGDDERPAARLRLFLRDRWAVPHRTPLRNVNAFAGGNMSFRRSALERVNGLDELLTHGGEDTDLCWRVHQAHPDQQLIYTDAAGVAHEYPTQLRTVLRRSVIYGRASAWLFVKWRLGTPTIFPGPSIVVLTAVLGLRYRGLLAVAAALPLMMSPRDVIEAVRTKHLERAADPYLRVMLEAADNLGFAQGIPRAPHRSAGGRRP